MKPYVRAQHAIRFSKMTTDQCEQMHRAVREILWEVGVEIHHTRALALLEMAGATIEGERARVPAELLDWAITAAPRSIDLHDRAGELVMPAGEDRVFFGCGSETPYIIDHRTSEHRHGTLEDVTEGARVIQALPNFDFDMSLFLPWDVDPKVAYLRQYREMLAWCDKPRVLITPSADDVRAMVEMLDAVVESAGAPGEAAAARGAGTGAPGEAAAARGAGTGGDERPLAGGVARPPAGGDERRARPRDVIYVNVTHPLRQEHDEVEKALFCAEAGMPFVYAASTIGGLMGPVTTPGVKALALAGDLVGVLLAQLVREGSPVAIAGGITIVNDMKSMLSLYAAPEDRMLSGDMCRFYGLPLFGLGGASDSKLLDEQAVAEAAMTLMTEALVGANFVHDIGYLEAGSANSLVMLAICDELISWVRGLMQPFEITDETLPMDLIRQLGVDGDYIGSDHTLRHFRSFWQPSLFDRGMRTHWEAAGGKRLAELAAEKIDSILAAGDEPLLDGDTIAALDEIIARHAGRARD